MWTFGAYRMKSAGGAKAGNWNLRGKKSIMCDCRCCDVVNFKEEYAEKLAIKEMDQAKMDIDIDYEDMLHWWLYESYNIE